MTQPISHAKRIISAILNILREYCSWELGSIFLVLRQLPIGCGLYFLRFSYSPAFGDCSNKALLSTMTYERKISYVAMD